MIADEKSAERAFADVIEIVLARFERRRLRHPRRIAQRIAQRAGQLIAARLRDRVDDAAAEPPVLGGDRAGQHGRLLDGILDVHRPHLPARLLRDRDAVDEHEVVVPRTARRCRARPFASVLPFTPGANCAVAS